MCDTLRLLDFNDDNEGEIQGMKHGIGSRRNDHHWTYFRVGVSEFYAQYLLVILCAFDDVLSARQTPEIVAEVEYIP